MGMEDWSIGNMKKAFGIQKVDLAADKISNLRNKALNYILRK